MKVFKVTLIILAVIAVILIAGVVYLRIIFPPPLSKEATEKDFIKNQENIMIVISYLINSGYDDMHIRDTDDSGTMHRGSGEKVIINDSKAIAAVDTLLKRKGYSIIEIVGNTINFQRSTRFMDFDSGVAYSIDGSEPELQFLTKLEPLSKPNWYYYEEDFNEWKRQNKE